VSDRSDFLAAWGDDRRPSKQGNHQVYSARVRADGTIVDTDGIAVDTRGNWAPPNVAVSATPKGWWVASQYSNFSVPTAKAWGISMHHVSANGSAAARIEASPVLPDRVDFDMAAAGDDALVAWAGVRRTKVEAALIQNGQRVPVTLPNNAGRRPAIAYDRANDNFVLVYRETSATMVVMIDRGGVVRTTLAIPSSRANVDDGVRVAANGSGEVLATWVEPDGRTITGSRIDVANAQIVASATVQTAPRLVLRHRLVRGTRGYLLVWHQQGGAVGGSWLDGGAPLGPAPRDVALPIVRPEEMPELQASDRGFLVTWTSAREPQALRLADDGTLVDDAPVSLRGARTTPVDAATLQTAVDVSDQNGADYCPQRRHGTVPGTVRGLYVVEGTQPWGSLYIPGFGWGGSTGSNPRQSFYVGRQPEFVPHFKALPTTAHPFELSVEVPDAKRKRTERIPVEPSDATASAAAGITGAINLVEFEANNGLGGHGFHFVVTKTKVIDDTNVLAPRFTAARAAFDKLRTSSRKDIDRALAEARRAALKANPHPIVKGTVAPAELVIYLPTYRPTSGHLEILFGYRVTNGVMMKFPPPKRGSNPHVKRPDDGPPPPNPRPLQWSVMFGARYTLDGDKLVSEEVWSPTVVGAEPIDVPWQCKPPLGHPSLQANVPACVGAPPSPKHTCVRDCGGPVVRDGDPPPGWSWLSPDQAENRRQYGCPICLPGTARIETPDGDVPISSLYVGAQILTLDAAGERVPATVQHLGSTLVGGTHHVVRIELADGRVVSGSAGHPHASGELGDLVVGDTLDHSRVTRVARVPLAGDRTWDILPSGSTGLYIVDGVVLRSSFVTRASRRTSASP